MLDSVTLTVSTLRVKVLKHFRVHTKCLCYVSMLLCKEHGHVTIVMMSATQHYFTQVTMSHCHTRPHLTRIACQYVQPKPHTLPAALLIPAPSRASRTLMPQRSPVHCMHLARPHPDTCPHLSYKTYVFTSLKHTIICTCTASSTGALQQHAP